MAEQLRSATGTPNSKRRRSRKRNILTLEERVKVIEEFNSRPRFTKVARLFNCSWEQVRNIVSNKDDILRFYNATKGNTSQQSQNEEEARRLEVRQRKIALLSSALYEYIQRAQYHAKKDITEELLRKTAIELRDLIQIEEFMPNKAWINHFKATYNFSLANRQIVIKRVPPSSLNLSDIVKFCEKNDSAQGRQQDESKLQEKRGFQATALTGHHLISGGASASVSMYRPSTLESVAQTNDVVFQSVLRRNALIGLLEQELCAYVQGYENVSNLEAIAKAQELSLNYKIEDFNPSKEWIDEVMRKVQLNISKKKDSINQNPSHSVPPVLRRSVIRAAVTPLESHQPFVESKVGNNELPSPFVQVKIEPPDTVEDLGTENVFCNAAPAANIIKTELDELAAGEEDFIDGDDPASLQRQNNDRKQSSQANEAEQPSTSAAAATTKRKRTLRSTPNGEPDADQLESKVRKIVARSAVNTRSASLSKGREQGVNKDARSNNEKASDAADDNETTMQIPTLEDARRAIKQLVLYFRHASDSPSIQILNKLEKKLKK